MSGLTAAFLLYAKNKAMVSFEQIHINTCLVPDDLLFDISQQSF